MATKLEILEVLEFLSEQIGYEPRSPEGYYLALSDYPKEQLMTAAVEHLKDPAKGQYYPKINELLNQVRKVPFHDPPIFNPFWRAMSVFSARLRGEITDQEFEGTTEASFIARTKANDSEITT